MSRDLTSLLQIFRREAKYFQSFSAEDFAGLAPFLELRHFSSGSALFEEGDEGDYIGLIVTGKLIVRKATEFKGKPLILAMLTGGAIVGEMSVIHDREKRTATVVAQEDAELLILNQSAVNRLVEEDPRTGVKLLLELNRIIALRLKKTVERMALMYF